MLCSKLRFYVKESHGLLLQVLRRTDIMLQFEELRLKLLESEKPLADLAAALGLAEAEKEIAELEAETAKDGFWNDIENSQKVNQRIARLRARIRNYDDLRASYEDALALIELYDEEEDLDGLDECAEAVDAVEKELDK